MKPCHSPYCECEPHRCTHPGFYDARHQSFTNACAEVLIPTHPTMKQTHKIAYSYCNTLQIQRAHEQQLNKILRCINSDNQLFGLADAIEGPYTKLVQELLGDTLFEWLMWWIYETDCGKINMLFTIDGVSHDPTNMTLYKFLEIVDASA